MPRTTIYQQDLAYIHVDGYGFHWEGAADTVLRFLSQHGIRQGTVVDLGCGGGQWLRRLFEEGFEVWGVDISPSMIRLARGQLPTANFIQGSFAEVDLPECDAVTSLGEPLNYLNGRGSIRRTFKSVYQSLRSGGLFVCDLREPATGVVQPRTVSRVGADWACIATITEDGSKNSIVREITTFRKVGHTYRRREEIHRLNVYSRREVSQWLRDLGFRVRIYRGYDEYRLASNHLVYVARKP